jgi:type II secretory pathway pseudopilin PulG
MRKLKLVYNPLLNEKGFSLITALAVSGIFLFIAANAFSILQNALNSAKLNDQKRAIGNLRTYLSSALRDGSVCRMMLTQSGPWIAGPTPATFNEAAVATATPPRIPLLRIMTQAVAAAPAIVIVGQAPDPQTPFLKISSIDLVVSGGSGNNYSGAIEVGLDSVSLGRNLAPISLKVAITASNAVPREVTSCAIEIIGSGSLRNQVISTSGTFTVPVGAKKIKATVVAAGGGGAGGTGAEQNLTPGATCTSGGSGGGGGTAVCIFDVTPGNTFTVTVGAGGAGGAGSGQFPGSIPPVNGGNGSASQFGTCQATGGQGGQVGINGIYGATGMDPGLPGAGIAGVNTVTFDGLAGNLGIYVNHCWISHGNAAGQYGGSSFGGGSLYGSGGQGGGAGGDYGLDGKAGLNGAIAIDWVD